MLPLCVWTAWHSSVVIIVGHFMEPRELWRNDEMQRRRINLLPSHSMNSSINGIIQTSGSALMFVCLYPSETRGMCLFCPITHMCVRQKETVVPFLSKEIFCARLNCSAIFLYSRLLWWFVGFSWFIHRFIFVIVKANDGWCYANLHALVSVYHILESDGLYILSSHELKKSPYYPISNRL